MLYKNNQKFSKAAQKVLFCFIMSNAISLAPTPTSIPYSSSSMPATAAVLGEARKSFAYSNFSSGSAFNNPSAFGSRLQDGTALGALTSVGDTMPTKLILPTPRGVDPIGTKTAAGFATGTIGANLYGADASLIFPAEYAVYSRDPIAKVRGKTIVSTAAMNNLLDNDKLTYTGLNGTLTNLKNGSIGADGRDFTLNPQNGNIKLVDMIGLSTAWKKTDGTNPGVVIDTGVGALRPKNGDIIPYENLVLLCTPDNMPNQGSNSNQGSNLLKDTLFGRVISATGLAFSRENWPTDAYWGYPYDIPLQGITANDLTANGAPSIATALSLRERWNAYNKTFDTAFNPLFNQYLSTTMSPSLYEMWTSGDSINTAFASGRIMGVMRKRQPIVQGSNAKTADYMYTIDRNPLKYDYDAMTVSASDSQELNEAAASMLSSIAAKSWTNNTLLSDVLNDLDGLLEGNTTGTATQKSATARMLQYIRDYAIDTQATNTSPSFAVSTFLANFGTANNATWMPNNKLLSIGNIDYKYANYIKTMDPSMKWDQGIVYAAKQLLKDTKVGLYVPGKKLQVAGANGNAVDYKDADGNFVYTPDFRKMLEGSTFGTIGNVNSGGPLQEFIDIINTTQMFGQDTIKALPEDYTADSTINGKQFKVLNNQNGIDLNKIYLVICNNYYDDKQYRIITLREFAATADKMMYLKKIAYSDVALSDPNAAIFKPATGNWKSSPFEFAVDTLRYSYDAHSKRYATLSTQHGTYLEAFLQGGAVVPNGETGYSNALQNSVAWLIANNTNPPTVAPDQTTTLMEFALCPSVGNQGHYADLLNNEDYIATANKYVISNVKDELNNNNFNFPASMTMVDPRVYTMIKDIQVLGDLDGADGHAIYVGALNNQQGQSGVVPQSNQGGPSTDPGTPPGDNQNGGVNNNTQEITITVEPPVMYRQNSVSSFVYDANNPSNNTFEIPYISSGSYTLSSSLGNIIIEEVEINGNGEIDGNTINGYGTFRVTLDLGV